MKLNAKELELLIEYMALISKHGRKRIEKVVDLLKDAKVIEDTTSILQKSLDILSLESNKSKNISDTVYVPGINENSNIIDRINNLLNDKKVFKTSKDLDSLIGVFLKDGINTSKKKDKIDIFCYYLQNMEEAEQNEILKVVENYNPKRKEKEVSYENDLSEWSDIIMKSKKE